MNLAARSIFMLSAPAVGIAALLLSILNANLVHASDEDRDFAVPAFSDLSLAGMERRSPLLSDDMIQANLNPLPPAGELKWLDLNQDLQLNEFDVKQFESIIESLNGGKLTGLQLASRFKMEQKNNKESFLMLYDLDRDGMFTPYDVDSFGSLIGGLDDGNLKGAELAQRFSRYIFPGPESPEPQPAAAD